MISATIFVISYLGIAVGKIPGIALDRVGIALLGAIGMVAFGVVTPTSAFQSIDLPTILLLYSLMIISAQLRLGGFYTWVAERIVSSGARPKRLLLASMCLSALLSALLANDIVCFAFTPVLTLALLQAGLQPLPYLLGLAVSSNIGSAATMIGNPQNMLIGQVGRVDFSQFFLWCAPPALLALGLSYGVILILFRNNFSVDRGTRQNGSTAHDWPAFDPWQTGKGLIAIALLVGLFFTSMPREIVAITIAGVLLCSRQLKTRDILGLVDWHLITLFCALFILIHGIATDNHLSLVANRLAAQGIDIHHLPTLTVVATLLSNLFSNVPATMIIIPFLDGQQPVEWYTLAVATTFAGNLFLLGSIANLIVVEQAGRCGITITLNDHARVGIPVTIISIIVLLGWSVMG